MLNSIFYPILFTIGQPNKDETIYSSISLSGTDSLTISNKEIIVNGQIELSEKSCLIILNSSLTINSNPRNRGKHRSEIVLLDESELILENVEVYINVDLEPNYHTDGRITQKNTTEIKIINSHINCSNYLTFSLYKESKFFIENSTLMGKAPHSNCQFSIEQILPTNLLRPLYDDYHILVNDNADIISKKSNIGAIYTENNATCTILDSTVATLSSSSLKKTYVTNSILKILKLGKKGGDLKFTGNHQGYHENWDISKVFGDNIINGNINLVNSSIDLLWLTTFECDSEIFDAEIGILSIYEGKTNISSSKIWILNNRTILPVYMTDSDIEYLTGWFDSLSVKIHYSNVNWLGLSGSDSISISTSDSELGTCKLYSIQKPKKLTIEMYDSKIKDLDLKTGKTTYLNFNNTIITKKVSLTKSDPLDNIIFDGSPIILKGVEMVENDIIFDSKNNNMPTPYYGFYIITYGLVVLLFINVIILIRKVLKY